MSASYRAKLSPPTALPFDHVELCAATDDPDKTRDLAAALSTLVRDGDLVVLSGDMGAGKTCFTQGLARGLGIEGRVTSPTFTLANTYDGRLVLNHLDVYRLEDPSETIDLDLPEMLESGVTVIEWGSQIDAVLPAERLEVEIRWPDSGDDDERVLTFMAIGATWEDRVAGLKAALAEWACEC